MLFFRGTHTNTYVRTYKGTTGPAALVHAKIPGIQKVSPRTRGGCRSENGYTKGWMGGRVFDLVRNMHDVYIIGDRGGGYFASNRNIRGRVGETKYPRRDTYERARFSFSSNTCRRRDADCACGK